MSIARPQATTQSFYVGAINTLYSYQRMSLSAQRSTLTVVGIAEESTERLLPHGFEFLWTGINLIPNRILTTSRARQSGASSPPLMPRIHSMRSADFAEHHSHIGLMFPVKRRTTCR
ncbi:unnamed protein product [Aspergillus oryzae RIB40]|uniref:DNA, SC005 n=1 Tax=Aspergillus oryzae (strain ATCC 42149 / RIB 40) TaxID=510516 RepID=Q2UQQ7_ASPOR|nr:unnamed protein product [Aspergillus oryzae RIB40]BAE56108.1 unnamed protein product [Aspergillus oryzae RIB40]